MPVLPSSSRRIALGPVVETHVETSRERFPVAEVNYHIDPLPPDVPEGLVEQVNEWSTRLFQDVFYQISRHLRLLGECPMPKVIEAQATNEKLGVTITIQFDRKES